MWSERPSLRGEAEEDEGASRGETQSQAVSYQHPSQEEEQPACVLEGEKGQMMEPQGHDRNSFIQKPEQTSITL